MRKILFYLFSFFLIAFVIAAPFLLLAIEKNTFSKGYEKNIILDLWHIDGFESAGSTKSFLDKQAINFNKTNKNIFIMTKVLTPAELVINLSAGIKPDLISFGASCGENVLSILKPIDKALPVRADLKDAASVNGQMFALPFAMSDYFLFSKNEDDFDKLFEKGEINKRSKIYSLVSSTKDLPLCALSLDEELNEKSVVNETSYLESDLALSMFKTDQAKFLLGKNKDLFALKNSYSGEFFIKPLSSFTEMVQYVGIVNSTYEDEITAFLKFIISDSAQQNLINYNMFNVINKNFYGTEGLATLEAENNKLKKTVSPFINKSNVTELKVTLSKFINGQKNLIGKIENYII